MVFETFVMPGSALVSGGRTVVSVRSPPGQVVTVFGIRLSEDTD
jgi:hypothetical protein